MPRELRALIGVVGFLSFYGLIMWAALRWARSRLLNRARLAAGSLTAVGARVLEVRPSPGWQRPAEVDFELDGRRARFDVRYYGRDWVLCSVRVESPPLPALLIRAEGAADRVGKSLGLMREVQLGDADFDAAAFITAAATDEQVRAVLQPPEVRRLVREVLRLGYRVDMSRDGLRATRLDYALHAFDGSPVPGVMRALEGLVAALPRVDPGTLVQPRVSMVSLPAVVALLGSAAAFVALLVLVPVLPAPLDDADSVRALSLGLVAWLPATVAFVALLRRRVRSMVEVFVVALALFVGVPSLTASCLFAANSRLDHSAATTRRAQVLSRQRRDSELYVTPWGPGPARQKVGVARAIWRETQVGDTIEVDTHPGALGWTWTSDVRRLP
ncbi:MAG: hypothetical protein JWM10_862 [Myxococcaceae bacterium]|nr:hypothetical protein [Myxococcaceae bacterium]